MLKIDIALVQILNTQLNTVTIKQNKGSVVHALLRAISIKRFNVLRLLQHVILSIYAESFSKRRKLN